jgi:beta-phosphoglucomutase
MWFQLVLASDFRHVFFMHKRTVIIFDLDGVLVDTATAHFNAWKSTAAEHGIHIDSSTERSLRGLSREKSFEVVFGGHSTTKSEAERICSLKNRRFLDELERMPPEDMLVPNARQLLEALRAGNTALVLASGSRNARTILQKTNLQPFFDLVIDGSIETEPKPDPAYYLNIMEQMKAAAPQTLLFEDSEACIEAANRLGIRTVAVNCPHDLPASLHIKNLENLSPATTLGLVQSATGD